MGLDIPYLLQCYNDYKFAQTMTPSMRIDALEEEKRPAACIGCGQCMHACPQGIDVPSALAELAKMYEENDAHACGMEDAALQATRTRRSGSLCEP